MNWFVMNIYVPAVIHELTTEMIWLLNVNDWILCEELGHIYVLMLTDTNIQAPYRGASTQGVFICNLKHFYAFTVEMNGALMVGSRFIIWCGRS